MTFEKFEAAAALVDKCKAIIKERNNAMDNFRRANSENIGLEDMGKLYNAVAKTITDHYQPLIDEQEKLLSEL